MNAAIFPASPAVSAADSGSEELTSKGARHGTAPNVPINHAGLIPSIDADIGHQTPNDTGFKAARRHSTLVAFLKVGLPVLAGLLVLVFATTILFWSLTPVKELKIESAAIEKGQLVMKAPSMAGFDSKNRPYDVKANKAVQDLQNPSRIKLDGIDAVLPMDGLKSANLRARSGTYDTGKETLKLQQDISIIGANGMEIEMQQADIDIKSGTMQSNDPVQVRAKGSTITADSVSVENNGDRIIFRNNVMMTIQPSALPPTTQPTNVDQ